MVKDGPSISAYQWSINENQWKKIGEVVDSASGADPSKKVKHSDGKEYDYVFDVDIADGAPPLKLPYNVTENPYIAAQRFLETNMLPLTYLDETVKFIEQNTSGVTLGQGSSEFVDPYTGGSRYQSTPSQPSNNNYQDTYSRSNVSSSSSTLPIKGPYLTFLQVNIPAMLNKVKQINESSQTVSVIIIIII